MDDPSPKHGIKNAVSRYGDLEVECNCGHVISYDGDKISWAQINEDIKAHIEEEEKEFDEET